MGSRVGVIKIAAGRLHLSLAEYLAKIDGGEKWCDRCSKWKYVGEFGRDSTRGDGRDAKCKKCRQEIHVGRYVPRPKPKHRPCYSKGGNPQSARVRIYQRIKRGEMPHPKTLPCTDCGHIWVEGERRHEYDHTHGYEAAHALTVEPVCTICHHRRGQERGTHIRKHAANGKFTHG